MINDTNGMNDTKHAESSIAATGTIGSSSVNNSTPTPTTLISNNNNNNVVQQPHLPGSLRIVESNNEVKRAASTSAKANTPLGANIFKTFAANAKLTSSQLDAVWHNYDKVIHLLIVDIH
jgi:hypothetical protein